MKTYTKEHREWTDRLSDYLEGDLSRADHDAVADHVGECGACRRVLEELREVRDSAGRLGPIEPPRDLWGGIAATIGAPVPAVDTDGAKVIALPGTAAARPVAPGRDDRRYQLSTRQLAAASVALIAASSMVTWLVGPGTGTPVAADPVASASVVSPVTMAATGVPLEAGLAEELAALEAALTETESALDPNTVRVLERNLAVIEKAIDDSARALAQDPGNEFLAAHLERVYERKLAYLRDAARVAEWTG